MTRERLEIEHLGAGDRERAAAVGSCRCRSCRRSPRKRSPVGSVFECGHHRAAVGAVAAVELLRAPADARRECASSSRCDCRRASSTPAAASRAACRRSAARGGARCCARPAPRRAVGPRTRSCCRSIVPTSRALGVADSTGQLIAPGMWSSANSLSLRTSMIVSKRSRCASASLGLDDAVLAPHRAFVRARSQQRTQVRPDVVQHARLRRVVRMDPIGLEPARATRRSRRAGKARTAHAAFRAPRLEESRKKRSRSSRARSWAARARRRAAPRCRRPASGLDHLQRDCRAWQVSGSPRRPSFAPSSSTTTAGRCCCSNAGRRVRPPLVVSPLMLAFTTV